MERRAKQDRERERETRVRGAERERERERVGVSERGMSDSCYRYTHKHSTRSSPMRIDAQRDSNTLKAHGAGDEAISDLRLCREEGSCLPCSPCFSKNNCSNPCNDLHLHAGDPFFGWT